MEVEIIGFAVTLSKRMETVRLRLARSVLFIVIALVKVINGMEGCFVEPNAAERERQTD